MPQITAPQYFLPLVDALQPVREFKTGKTIPLVLRGVCVKTGIKDDYVVKLKASEQMWQGSSMNELLASFIGMEIGLNVAEPAIINISRDFAESVDGGFHNRETAFKSLGYNFGSKLQGGGFQELAWGRPCNPDIKEKLLELFAFDCMIGNADRRKERPNFLTNGKEVLAFDHELAFSFEQLISFARKKEPWLFDQTDNAWLEQNYCYNLLRGGSYDFEQFCNQLRLLTDKFWTRAFDLIPDEWQNEHFDPIKKHITLIAENNGKFAIELNRILL